MQEIKELNNLLSKYVDEGFFPGIQWKINFNNEQYYGKYGFNNIETNESILDNTLYRIWSMTKPIIAIAALQLIEESIKYAKSNKLKVRFTAEDASRTDLTFLLKVGELVEKAGADRFSLADTVGILHPNKVSELVTFFVSRLKIPIHMHCHNDFGLATANALQAIQSGAKCVDVTINGLGERCGLPPLAEVSAALDELLNVGHAWDLSKLNEMSIYMDDITKIKKNNTRPITGEYSFSHKAGLHINAMLKNPKSYESMSPKKLNREHEFIIDKYASKDAIRDRLDKLFIKYNEDILNDILLEIKDRPQVVKWTDKKIKQLVENLQLLKTN